MLKSVSTGFIETETEADACLVALKAQLMASITAGDRVRIEGD